MNGDDTDLFFGENEKDGNKDKTKEWFLKNWKMIAAFIVVIVIGGSVYSYSQKATIENSEANETENQESITSEEKTDEEINNEEKITMEESAEGSIVQSENEEMDILTTIDEQNTESVEIETTEKEKSKEKEFTGETFTEAAEQGEGITHLARKALKNYLAEEEGLELSKEQKIYIEDFLQNETGIESLELGEEREFSKNLIESAVESSQKLSDEQLERIEQFSALAPSLI